MIITLIGYMGSGKSLIASQLSKEINSPIIDTDFEISKRINKSIGQIFETKGELYFRRQEKEILEEILATHENLILSVGGGTPCYYNNMELLNSSTHTVFLQASVSTLTKNLLLNKNKRPLISRISDEELPEFIAKHLFERNIFYTQAQTIIITDGKTPDEITLEIKEKIFRQDYT